MSSVGLVFKCQAVDSPMERWPLRRSLNVLLRFGCLSGPTILRRESAKGRNKTHPAAGPPHRVDSDPTRFASKVYVTYEASRCGQGAHKFSSSAKRKNVGHACRGMSLWDNRQNRHRYRVVFNRCSRNSSQRLSPCYHPRPTHGFDSLLSVSYIFKAHVHLRSVNAPFQGGLKNRCP